MRILPHHEDTGGFFVAVLEKVKPLPWESETCIFNQNAQDADVNEDKEMYILEEEALHDIKHSEGGKRILEGEKKSRELQKKRRRTMGYREDPFVFFKDQTEDVWQSIK
jgi:tRNA (cytosine34-C5)-methyltransferase